MKSLLLKFLLGLPLSIFLLIAFFAAWGAIFRPDLPEASQENYVYPHEVTGEYQAVDLVDPAPRFVVEVDYEQGGDQAWSPKGEAPFLRDLVEKGELAPVAERIGPEPMVLSGVDGVGRYGGTWLMVSTTRGDVNSSIRFLTNNGTLIRWSPQGYPLQPNLAKAWEANDDATVWTFHLREGVRWSDGEPYTTEDVRFAHEVLYPFLISSDDSEEIVREQSWLRHRGKYGMVEIIDEHTFQVRFEDPYVLFPERLASQVFGDLVAAPKHYLNRFVPEPLTPIESRPDLVAALETSGYPDARAFIRALLADENPELPRMTPWIYTQHQTNPPISFVRNPYYWAVDEAGNQLPYIDEVLISITQEQQIPTLAANGGLTFQHRHLRFSDYTLLVNSGNRGAAPFEVYHWYPGERSAWTLFPNLTRTINPFDNESARKAALLSERDFRRALSVAIDRDRIIRSVYSGIGTPSQIEPGASSAFHSEELRSAYVQHDPEMANRLLDDLGLTQRDREGYRTYADGTSMSWFIDYTAFTGPGPIDLIVDDFRQVGIRAISRERGRSLFYVEHRNGWTDLAVWSGAGEVVPLVQPRSFAPTNHHSFQFPLWGRWFDLGGFYDTDGNLEITEPSPPRDHPAYRVLELLDEAWLTTDADERSALLHEIFRINAEEVWSISITSPPPIVVYKDRDLRNVPTVATQSYVFSSPSNAAPETFYFASETFASGALRTTAAKERLLQQYTMNPTPQPALMSADSEGSSIFALIGRLIVWMLAVVAILVVLMIARRHPYIGRRLAVMIPTMAIVSVIVFSIVQIPPGNFIDTRIAELEAQGNEAAESMVEDLKELYWLDEPGWVQYLNWLGVPWFVSFEEADRGLLQGYLGRSMESDQPVNAIVGDRLILTVCISIGTILFTWLLAIPIGIYSAVRQYTIGDYFFTAVGIAGMCIPNFLLALLLGFFGKAYFGVEMTGLFSPQFAAQPYWNFAKVLDLLAHIWVPVIVIGISGTAGMIRVMRGNLLDELKKPYVTTALAKGVRPMKLLFKYPVRLALNPFISTIGGLFPALVSGGAVVAIVLSLPTVGPLLLGALLTEDMYLAGSLLMVLSLLGIIGTLISDLLLLWLDPRIRMEGGSR